jgi:hypothetical protein
MQNLPCKDSSSRKARHHAPPFSGIQRKPFSSPWFRSTSFPVNPLVYYKVNFCESSRFPLAGNLLLYLFHHPGKIKPSTSCPGALRTLTNSLYPLRSKESLPLTTSLASASSCFNPSDCRYSITRLRACRETPPALSSPAARSCTMSKNKTGCSPCPQHWPGLA